MPRAGRVSAALGVGVQRLSEGFNINELVSEYRALRATVLRLWLRFALKEASSETSDLIRFNEAIDQAIAESVLRFSAEADHAKDLLLAVLGHDLRNPLNAIRMSTQLIERFFDRAREATPLIQEYRTNARDDRGSPRSPSRASVHGCRFS